MPPDVTLCIINFNGEMHLARALEAVRNQSWPFAEIVIVDNGSTDRSIDVIQALCPEAKVVRLPENRGPGAARNAGFRAARHDLILFQDNDIELQHQTTIRLTDHVTEHKDTLVVAPRVVFAHDPQTVQCDSADCHYLGLMAIRNAETPVGKASDRQPSRTTSLTSGCFLVNRTLWRGDHLFDEDFGFNLEDHDLGVRACLTGHQLWVCPEAIVYHGSGTPGLSHRGGAKPGDLRLFCLIRNRWMIAGRYFSARTLILLAPALLAYEIMQLAWLVLSGRLAVWWKALCSLFSMRQKLLRERADYQEKRSVPDKQILTDCSLPLTRYVRGGIISRLLISVSDRLLRLYWRLIRTLV